MATTRTTKRPAAKERLSRDAVVSSALDLADAEGLEAVTIRRLATDLGVTPMALYWHFRDKERLLDGIAERILDEVRIDAPGEAQGEWYDQLRAVLAAMLEQMRAHPAAAELIHTRILLSQAGLQLTERVLGLLQGAGFEPELSGQLGVAALSSMIQLVTNEPGLYVGVGADEREQMVRTKKARLHELSPQKYPALLSSMDALFDCDDSPAYFAMGLDLYIAGVRHLQSSAR